MGTNIYIQGALEPIETGDPFQATMVNMSSALNNQVRFLMTKNTKGINVAVTIDKVLYLEENGQNRPDMGEG